MHQILKEGVGKKRADYKRVIREFLGIFIMIVVVATWLHAVVNTQNYTPKRPNLTTYNAHPHPKSILRKQTWKRPKGIFQDDRNVLSWLWLWLCKCVHLSKLYTLKVGVFYWMVVISKADFKKCICHLQNLHVILLEENKHFPIKKKKQFHKCHLTKQNYRNSKA